MGLSRHGGKFSLRSVCEGTTTHLIASERARGHEGWEFGHGRFAQMKKERRREMCGEERVAMEMKEMTKR